MPSEPAQDLVHILSHAERRLVQRLATLLAEEDCSVERWRVLSAIADGQGHPMTEVAEYALMLPPTLTKLVDRMADDNLVYRRPDPDDRRRVFLYLSARGRVLHQRVARRVEEDQAHVLAALSDSGELARTLGQLADVLDTRTGVAAAHRAGH